MPRSGCLGEYQLQNKKCVTIHNINHQLNISTIPNCVTNHGKRRATHSVEKEIPANDHTLSDRVINRGKQSVAHSRETKNFANNLDQQKTIYYCMLRTITMTCYYDNIFTGKTRYRTTQSVLLSGRSCLQAVLNHTVLIGRSNITLTKHCVKNVQIRSYFWSVFSCIQTECRKIRTRNNSVFGHFSSSEG